MASDVVAGDDTYSTCFTADIAAHLADMRKQLLLRLRAMKFQANCVARQAVALARAAYKQRQKSGIPLVGSASFHAGNMRSVFRSRAGQRVWAFFSNRVLHLLSETDFRDAMREAIRYLEQDAYFCVSARSPDDFNPAVMEWMPGKEEKLAKYKDSARDGHEIAFVTKERLLRAVGHDLRDTNFLSATEPERVGAPDTHLLVMLGRTKHRRTIV